MGVICSSNNRKRGNSYQKSNITINNNYNNCIIKNGFNNIENINRKWNCLSLLS